MCMFLTKLSEETFNRTCAHSRAPCSLTDIHQGLASPDHHWSTTEPVMLDDFEGRIIFAAVSSVSFMSVTCTQCESDLIFEENRTLVDFPALVFSATHIFFVATEKLKYKESFCFEDPLETQS